jgi:hypothetical protein
MTRGKHWSAQQEAELKTLIDSNLPLEDIAKKLDKTPGAVYIKCTRLGLKLPSASYVRNPVVLPRDLPSVEETLRMLAGSLKAATRPGLDRVEVQRIQAVASIAKSYKETLADYINYREIENKLKEMETQNARLLKELEELNAQLQKERARKENTSDDASKPDTAAL